MAYRKNNFWKGFIAYAILFLILVSTNDIIPKYLFFIEDHENYIGESPWYFILNDLSQGIAATIGLVLSLLLALFYHIKWKLFYFEIIFLSLIIYLSEIGDGIRVLLTTNDIFNPAFASTQWQSADQYISSDRIIYHTIFLIVISVLYVLIKKKEKTNQLAIS